MGDTRQTVLAVIPARGGSKGIPRKNLVPIAGVPLIVRTIRAAKACAAIDDVIVTTDSEDIADVASAAGAGIVHRPAELASDTASSESACAHALDVWQQTAGRAFDILLLVQNTSPFHDPEDMGRVIAAVAGGPYKSCITVTETYRYFWMPGDGGWHMPYQKRARRQDRSPWYQEAGSVYAVRAQEFRQTGSLFLSPVGTVTIPLWRAFEIDHPDDLPMAEALAEVFERPTKHGTRNQRETNRGVGS
jgi:N-acylneuraminate cytidylyltransferase